MMLVLYIAAGIVLGFVALAYLRVVLVGAAVVAVLAGLVVLSGILRDWERDRELQQQRDARQQKEAWLAQEDVWFAQFIKDNPTWM